MIDEFIRETGSALSNSQELADSLGDITLNLELRRNNSNLWLLSLEKRKKDYSLFSAEERLDTAAYSNIMVPKTQKLGELSASDNVNWLKSRSGILYRKNGVFFDRDQLVIAVHDCFLRIRGYEDQMIDYTTHGGTHVRRKARVSVTGMELLHEFESDALKNLPETYDSYNHRKMDIFLPAKSTGISPIILSNSSSE